MRAVVIGLGNDQRGDDGLGLEAARRLAPALEGVAEVHAHPGEPVDLIASWEGADLVVLIDAAHAGGRPGEVHRFVRGRDPLPTRRAGPSSHAFDLAVAIELAQTLGLLTGRLVLYAVEGARFGLGDERSDVGEAALATLVPRVRADVLAALS